MKKFLSIIVCVSISYSVNAQSSDQNYIKSTEYLSDTELGKKKVDIQYIDGLGRPMQNISVKQSANQKDIVQPIIYDEFGRQAKDYLPYPTTQSNGSFVSDASLDSEQFYQIKHGSSVSYSEKEFEDSPLNRVLKQAAPGEDWRLGSGHEIEFDYQTNTSNEVIFFKADVDIYNNTIQLLKSGNYQPNQLYKTITKDENHTTGKDHTIEEFKNKQGEVVLKRTYSDGIEHNTYYVYDIYGNLTYVLPPLINTNTVISQDALNKLGYQYKYDERNRLIEKKLPSKGWEYMAYDKQNRLVASQDANMRSTNVQINPFGERNKVWLFTKYDKFGRVIYTGYYKNNGDRKIIQDHIDYRNENNEGRGGSFNESGLEINYTNTGAFPYGNYDSTILSVNYYDDYNFPHAVSVPDEVDGQQVINQNSSEASNFLTTKGLQTASFIRILDSDAFEKSYIFYDLKGRAVRSYTKHYRDGYHQVDSKLDFRGKVLKSTTLHKKDDLSNIIQIVDNFKYDHAERLLKQTQKINNQQEELISYNQYDELGQLKNKKVGGKQLSGSTGLQQIDYKYNIRGWLTNINDTNGLKKPNQNIDLFAFDVNYYDGIFFSQNNVRPLYNGNIAQTEWLSLTDYTSRNYVYSYDALNRLTSSYYGKNGVHKKNFDEYITYDKNGNIESLIRWGTYDGNITPNQPDLDELRYSYYNGTNQLQAVSDITRNPNGFKDGASRRTEYQYDPNGNMISDANKGITHISYNHLNLPTEINFNNGGKINYRYNASGQKIAKLVYNTRTTVNTEYIYGFQYKNNVLQFFPHPEGYVKAKIEKTDTRKRWPSSVVIKYNFTYVYNYKDHLGNTRLSYSDVNGDGIISTYKEKICRDRGCNYVEYITKSEILEESHFYPFGLQHTYNAYPQGNKDNGYKYKFNGKELQDELGLDWYDYGARNYDAAIGRWRNVDPLAEEFPSWSPYNFTYNNPINFIDPDGRAAFSPIYGTDGEFLGTDDQGLQGEAIIMDEADFTQGMSHNDALSKSLGAEGLSSDAAKTKLIDHYNGLKDRPDYDGYLTFGEVTKWSNQGNGEPLFVDATKINLNAINVPELKKDKDGYINFFPNSAPNTGLVYGTIKLNLLNENTGAVRLGGKNGLLDVHNFKNPVFKTINDYLSPGTPTDFNIYCAPCNTKIRTAAEVKEFREQINKVRNERPKF